MPHLASRNTAHQVRLDLMGHLAWTPKTLSVYLTLTLVPCALLTLLWILRTDQPLIANSSPIKYSTFWVGARILQLGLLHRVMNGSCYILPQRPRKFTCLFQVCAYRNFCSFIQLWQTRGPHCICDRNRRALAPFRPVQFVDAYADRHTLPWEPSLRCGADYSRCLIRWRSDVPAKLCVRILGYGCVCGDLIYTWNSIRLMCSWVQWKYWRRAGVSSKRGKSTFHLSPNADTRFSVATKRPRRRT